MSCPACGVALPEAAVFCPACGADLTPLASGAVLASRYEIRSLLGRGGMGSVYRAFDRVLQEEVALKVQRAAAGEGDPAERRFRNEVRLARQVTHRNVCRLHDGGQEGSRRWISMELVEGVTLADRLRDGPVPLDEAWSLALQAADGLAAVHHAGVVHRDVKPLNLMVDGEGRVRLMDFGIAKPAATGDTAGGYAFGSPEYMSPEQARGRPTEARSDVYSLAVVLFELFTGAVPFRADTPVATLLQHLEAKPSLEALPAAVRPVLARALAKNPLERYADGAALARALHAAHEGTREPRHDGVAAGAGRRAWLVAAGAFGLLVLAAVLAVLWRSGWRDRPAPVQPAVAAAPSRRDREATLPQTTISTLVTPRGTAARAVARKSPAPTAPALPPKATPSPAAGATPPPETTAPVALTTAAAASTASAPPPPVQADGALLVLVTPWADVTVDGVPRGQIPLGPIRLAPGAHTVLLEHPDYQPVRRKVTIRSGETQRLAVDLPSEGVRRRR